MKVILLERLEGWGVLGDVVTVKDGFARNYLLPRHKALRANAAKYLSKALLHCRQHLQDEK